MKWLAIVFTFLILCSCGSIVPDHRDSLVSLQPYVVAIEPSDGATVDGRFPVRVEFSRPVAIDSVDPSTLAVMKQGEDELDDLLDDLSDGSVSGVEGIYEFADNGRVTVFSPEAPYESGATYLLIATNFIRSSEGLPLNQSAGASPTPFVSTFAVEGEGGAAGGRPCAGASGEEGEGESKRARPAYLVINEIMYDAAGSDTEGQLFVELAGEPGGDITGYEVVFVNGDNGEKVESVTIPDDETIPEDGLYLIADAVTGSPGVSAVEGADHVENFDPQNGPDCVQLLDHNGALLDALGYGEVPITVAFNGLACFEGAPAVDVPGGQSLSRQSAADTQSNSTDFQPMEAPTPGLP